MTNKRTTLDLTAVRQALARLDAIVVEYPYLVKHDDMTACKTWSANDVKRVISNENRHV